jgi:hypothetical protein
MRRTLIQLEEATYRRLRQAAFTRQRSVSSLVRECVDREFGTPQTSERAGPVQFASIGAGRSRQGRLAPVSERHDEALARKAR